MGVIDQITERTVRIENNKIFECIKKAFLFLLPVFLIGAATLTLQNFPITPVREFLNSVFNGFFYNFFNTVYAATYGFASFYLVITLSYCLSLQKKNLHGDVKVFCVLTAAISYLASLGKVILESDSDIVPYTNMSNIFPAMIATIISTNLFFLFYKLFNRNKLEHSTTFSRSLRSILPLAACVSIFAVASALIGLIDGVNNINDIILNVIARPFESIGATYFGGLLIIFAESVLWLFGIHGGNVFDSVLNSTSGAFAFANGQITTKPFIDTFALLGGAALQFVFSSR